MSTTSRPDLSKPILTRRFELVPVGRLAAARMTYRIEQDPEVLALLRQSATPRSFIRILLKTKRAKTSKRMYHHITDRETGDVIGSHYLSYLKYNSATMQIVIHRRDWWGKGVVVEVRKALISAYTEATGVDQFTAEVHSRNFASIINYRKLGFEHIGIRYSGNFDETRQVPADYFTFSLRGDALKNQIEAWKKDGV